jgi:hypothetical protein
MTVVERQFADLLLKMLELRLGEAAEPRAFLSDTLPVGLDGGSE